MISVIIATYNRANTIMRSVESVLNQTYKDLELIVVDDGSTDESQYLLSKIKDPRFIYIRQENKGACIARNKGLDAASGEYVALHDSDDEWHLDKLEKQIKVLQKTRADLVFCKYNRHELGKEPKKGPMGYREGFLSPVTTVYGIGTQTLIARRQVFEEYQFDVDMPRFQDLELLMRISKKYSIYCLDEALVEFYTNESSISKNPEKLYKACILLWKKHPELLQDFPEMTKSFSNLIFCETGWMDDKKSNQELKRKMFKLAYKFDPSLKTRIKIILKYLNLYNLVEKVVVK